MLDRSYTFLFLGRSGCGKGTQAELLINYLKSNDTRSILYIYAGDKMRELIKREDNLTAKKAEKVMMMGGKQPDFLAVWSWSNEFVEKMSDDVHVILDGSPRTEIEARVLDEAFDFYGRGNIMPIYINVSRKWATDKLLKRGRFDDTEERVKNRMDYFDKFVYPAIEYYKTKSKNKIIEINGEFSIEEVHQEVMQKLNLK